MFVSSMSGEYLNQLPVLKVVKTTPMFELLDFTTCLSKKKRSY